MADIFLSYASADRERIRPLVAVLEGNGWSVWWDRDIDPGVSFQRSISKAIARAKCVIVCWSERSVISDWVVNEAGEGKERGILVPVLIDSVRPPLGFRLDHAVTLTGWTGDASDPEFTTLIKAVTRHLGEEPAPDPRAGAPASTSVSTPVATRQAAGTVAVRYRFGPFELDVAERRLRRSGTVVSLQPRAFDLLLYLVERHGRLATKETLLDEVWSGTVVTENSLTQSVRLVRVALGDHADAPEFLETVPRIGYRFIAEVLVEPSKAEERGGSPLLVRRVQVAAGLAIGIVLLVGLFWQRWLPIFAPDMKQNASENTVGVLPFESCDVERVDPSLARGITADVINRLAEARVLKVMAPGSSFIYAGTHLEVSEIARSLGVHHVLRGTLCRSGTDLVLTADLVDENEFLVWRGEVAHAAGVPGATGGTLAGELARQVGVRLGGSMPVEPGPVVDPVAYEDLLIGIEYWKVDRIDEARRAFERALAREPDYPEAILALALLKVTIPEVTSFTDQRERFKHSLALLEEAEPLARAIANQYPDKAEAHHTLGRILSAQAGLTQQQAFRETPVRSVESLFGDAEVALRRAVALNPSLTAASVLLGNALKGLNRQADALEVVTRALDTDPFNASLNLQVAADLQNRGHYREAVALLERLTALPESSPNVWFALLELHHIHHYYDEYAATLFELLKKDDDRLLNWPGRDHSWMLTWFLIDLGLDAEADSWRARMKAVALPDNWREFFEDGILVARGMDEIVAERWRERLDAMGDQPVTDYIPFRIGNAAVTFAITGDYTRAISLLEALQGSYDSDQRGVSKYLFLVHAYLRVGRDADADLLLDQIVADLEAEVEAGTRNGESLYQLASAYALDGREQPALQTLRMAVDAHFRADGTMLDPWWEPMLAHPQYQALIQIMEADLDMQAAAVRQIFAEHDIDTLTARLPTGELDSP